MFYLRLRYECLIAINDRYRFFKRSFYNLKYNMFTTNVAKPYSSKLLQNCQKSVQKVQSNHPTLNQKKLKKINKYCRWLVGQQDFLSFTRFKIRISKYNRGTAKAEGPSELLDFAFIQLEYSAFYCMWVFTLVVDV